MYVAKPDGKFPSFIPDLKEEIDRKAHETLSWLVTSVVNDKITEDQFSTGVDVLFMAVSGLAGKDFIDLITKAGDLVKADEGVPLEDPKQETGSSKTAETYDTW